ncbi:Cytochrome P450 - like 10 [Theobroma cacao]|nr:Cytochrome P450 - like 10 [Theobroma cacao]
MEMELLASEFWVVRKSVSFSEVASGARPFLGHLHLLGGSKPAHVVLGDLADTYGPIFTIRLGVRLTLVVSNWEIAKECFTTNDKAFANRPRTLAAELLGYNYAMFGFSPYGPYWRQIRKIVTLEVLSNHRLEKLKHIRESEVRTSIKELYKLGVEGVSNSSSGKVLVEMKRWFWTLNINMVFKMVVGKRYSEAETSHGKDENDRRRKAFRDFFELTGTFTVGDSLPFLRWLDLGGHEKAMKKTAKELDHILEEWLEEHKQKRNSGNAEMPHESMEDCVVSGYHIPAGTRLLINLYKIHRDPHAWSDPCEFQPERFLTTYKDFDVRGQNFELIPFGSGRRMCPGVSLALQVLELTLANLLQGFELGTPLDEPVDMGEAIGITNLKVSPLEVLITPRLPAVCY